MSRMQIMYFILHNTYASRNWCVLEKSDSISPGLAGYSED